MKRYMRKKAKVPAFPGERIPFWDNWFGHFEHKKKVVDKEVVQMRRKFAFRMTLSGWMRFLEDQRQKQYVWKQTVAFCQRYPPPLPEVNHRALSTPCTWFALVRSYSSAWEACPHVMAL